MKTALLAGGTGLVGAELLSLLLSSPRYSRVIALTRRKLSLNHARLTNIVTDFQQPDTALAGLKPDDVFCCLGTTMAKAGSKEKFFEVDFEYPLALAKATRGMGASQYLLVTALGADKDSAVYYNRVKGEVEQAVQAPGFPAVHIFRPSLLLGRRMEKRAGEHAAKLIFRVFNFMIPAKFKPIEARTVARAMLVCASKEEKGIFIHESKDMQTMPWHNGLQDR